MAAPPRISADRMQGIPAAFVLGFKGCEHDENGKYLVRQEHAHAWVCVVLLDEASAAGRAGVVHGIYGLDFGADGVDDTEHMLGDLVAGDGDGDTQN